MGILIISTNAVLSSKINTMKKALVLLAFSFSFMQSCNLLFGEEDEFTCDKNAPVKVNDVDKCAFAVGKDYSYNANTTYEQLTIAITYGGGSFEINIHTNDIKEGITYSYPGDVDLSFAELNKGGSGTVLITSYDRTARSISGQFNLSAEGAANYTAYEYNVSGRFTDVSF